MTPETTPEPARPATKATAGGWAAITGSLRSRFPKATDGILFCLYKLEQDASLTIPDFREEAALHGITLGGRALHSAKVLLGLIAPPGPRKSATSPNGRTGAKADYRPPVARGSKSPSSSLEDQVMRAITQIQDSATDQSRRLREAIREAIGVLERALDD